MSTARSRNPRSTPSGVHRLEADPGIPKIKAAAEAEPGDRAGIIAELAEGVFAEMQKQHGGGGGGPSGPGVGKVLKRHKWLAALIALLFGSGGVLTTLYVADLRSKDNAEKVDGHIELPMHHGTAKEITKIRTDVKTVTKEVGKIQTQQKTIASGIEQLKLENIKRIEEERDELRRENRRLRRNR